MDFEYSPKVKDLQAKLTAFMQDHVIPAEAEAQHYLATHPDHWGWVPVTQQLKEEAKRQGLWNLFLPEDDRGAGLTNVDYAPLAELSGWSPMLGPEAINGNAPDTGNMELLSRFGTPEQQERWLTPLLNGDIRSAFSMTEPDVASSDANNIRMFIERDGDEWVLNGRKWWTTNALRPEVQLLMVMGVTDPDAPVGRRHSIILVPKDTEGVDIVRSTHVLGFEDRQEGGHAEIEYRNVRVPVENLLGEQGAGFAVVQARLGPGRIHHCMRLIGMAERAIALMVKRSQERTTFGVQLSEQGVVQHWIAEARVKLDSARLTVLHAAWRMDVDGNKAARNDIAAAKILVPAVVKEIVDKAMQLHGGGGLSQDTILPHLYSQARFLQIADGPDEVHLRSVAKAEFKANPIIKLA